MCHIDTDYFACCLHKTRECNLWKLLRIIMPLSFIVILTFELLNSFTWHAVQWLWTKLMHRVILKSHNEWHSYGPDKIIYCHLWPLNSKVWPWPWRYRTYSFAWHTVQWWWTKEPNDIKKSYNIRHSYGLEMLIYGHFWPLNLKCDLDLGYIEVILFARHTVQWWSTNVPNDFKISQWTT
jgi:hypothetical protein